MFPETTPIRPRPRLRPLGPALDSISEAPPISLCRDLSGGPAHYFPAPDLVSRGHAPGLVLEAPPSRPHLRGPPRPVRCAAGRRRRAELLACRCANGGRGSRAGRGGRGRLLVVSAVCAGCARWDVGTAWRRPGLRGAWPGGEARGRALGATGPSRGRVPRPPPGRVWLVWLPGKRLLGPGGAGPEGGWARAPSLQRFSIRSDRVPLRPRGSGPQPRPAVSRRQPDRGSLPRPHLPARAARHPCPHPRAHFCCHRSTFCTRVRRKTCTPAFPVAPRYSCRPPLFLCLHQSPTRKPMPKWRSRTPALFPPQCRRAGSPALVECLANLNGPKEFPKSP